MSQIPPEFDEYQSSLYDPQYTADISMLMHVPDRIEVAGSDDTDSLRPLAMMPEHVHMRDMVVPEKIVVLGQERSAGVRNDLDLHLDFVSVHGESMFVNLATPPRVLTLDDRSFPTVDDGEHFTANGQVASGDFEYELKTNGRIANQSRVAAREIAAVQRHLAVLSDHVKKLEAENARRWKRELFLYPVLLGYVMLKVARWLVTAK